MKKLMIALVAIVAGIAANAASFTWTTKGRIYDGAGADDAAYASGMTAYLMFASTVTQADLVESFISNASTAKSTVTGGAIYSATINDEARVSVTTAFSSSVTESQTAYYVIFNGDKMYVSGTKAATYNSLDPDEVNLIEFAAETVVSKLTFADTTTTYQSAGWYSSVPEPTSGLLMLLGMAGLALKRKKA